ncbi:MAG: translation initiation factor IF-2 [Pseudomonadota bacterium]
MQGRQSMVGSGGASPKKIRLYEVAKELGVPNSELLVKVQELGIPAKNHMSFVDVDEAQRVKEVLTREKSESQQVEHLSATVIRRRSRTNLHTPSEVTSGVPTRRVPRRPVEVVEKIHVQELAVEPELDEEVEVLQAAPQSARVSYIEPVVSEQPSAEPEEDGIPEETEVISVSRMTEIEEPLNVVQPGALVPPSLELELEKEPIDEGKVPSFSPDQNRVSIRYAPGFEPGGPLAQARLAGQHGVRTKQPPALQSKNSEEEIEHLSAAEVAKMMATPRVHKPKVVITDLDAQRRAGGVHGEPERVVASRFKATTQRRDRKKKTTVTRKARKTEITTPAEHKRVIRMDDAIGVGEIAHQMGVKSTEVLKKLWAMGLTKIMINQSIDSDTAAILASEFGYDVENVAFREDQILVDLEDKEEDLQPRAPVITVMGHVDHGKTSLLDAIRGASVASGEAGGITQHIGAYRVCVGKSDLVFIDTPGHEAFTEMRARGANCTDIVVLLVAADDGVMPQTIEAIDHAKEAGVPIIVALNKIDLPNANRDPILKNLADHNLVPEKWGGDTIIVEVSARTKQGVDDLLENIGLQAELLELKANPEKPGKGVILEACLDKARGPMATVLVQEGTLRVGDTVVAGEHLGKVRALLNDKGEPVELAGPSTPVEVIGLSGVPGAGDMLNVLSDEKAARTLADHRRNQTRRKELAGTSAEKTVEDILGQIRSGNVKEIKLLVKADVQGSAGAVKEALSRLSTEKVTSNVISAGVGGITETDINLAKASGAIVLGFNVRATGKANQLAEREGVDIRIYHVIYEMLDEVKELMRGLLPKERHERLLGRVEVRQTFAIPKIGIIAGCSVVDGKVTRKSHLRLIRDNVQVYDGRVGSLKRFKDDVREVLQGYECGISIDGHNDIEAGDIIEAYDVEEVAPDL